MREVTMVPVVRLEKPTLEEFRCYARQEIPLVITEAMSDWKALSTWTTEYLENKTGNTQVPVLVTGEGQSEGRFFYQGNSKSAEVQMRKCLGLLNGDRPRVYLAAIPLAEYIPSLLEDIQVPNIIPQAASTSARLWISGNGSIGPLHYDLANNIHTLVRGRKRFRLFDFEQISNLYPNSLISLAPHCSQVDPDSPDYERFPRFRRATGYDVTLNPGEMLYIPTGYWHQVVTLEPSIAVNFWLEKRLLRRSSLRLLCAVPVLLVGSMITRFNRKDRPAH